MILLTPFQGALAALADSEVSAPLYLAAGYQLLVLGAGCIARLRACVLYRAAAGLSHALLPLLLVAGWYFATRPPA